MSDPAPPAVAEGAAERPRSLSRAALTAALDDLGGWLDGLTETPPATATALVSPPGAGLDLHTLLAQFTSLRHEINLQTRAARTQQEQTTESLRQAALALEALRSAQTAQQQTQHAAADNLLRPLLLTLVELHDALTRTSREFQRALDAVATPPPPNPPLARGTLLPAPEEVPEVAPLSWWARLLGARSPDAAALAALRSRLAACRQQQEAALVETPPELPENMERARQILASVAAGYTMTVQRVERALSKHGVEPIPALDEPYDPERMEAVEAVRGSGRPSGEVLDEVRRGYLYQGRVFRYAQVRVAKD
jgi:molecular chaperone GrpE